MVAWFNEYKMLKTWCFDGGALKLVWFICEWVYGLDQLRVYLGENRYAKFDLW